MSHSLPIFSKILFGNDFKFITLFLQAFDTTEESDKRALQGIVSVLIYEEQFDACFSHLLELEVKSSNSNSGILRGATACTRLITEYLHMHSSLLNTVVLKILQKSLKKGYCSEINPSLVDDPIEIKKRTKNLLKTAEKVFSEVIRICIPNSLSLLCQVVAKSLQQENVDIPKSDLSQSDNIYEHFAVSNTIFLHFLCPFLTNPPTELKKFKNAHRTCIMLAKLFQALANGVEFEASWMQECNTFVRQQRSSYEQFCSNTINPSKKNELFSLPMKISTSSPVIIMNRWKAIYRWMKTNDVKMLAHTKDFEREEYTQQIEQIHLEISSIRNVRVTEAKSQPMIREAVTHRKSKRNSRKTRSINGLYAV